MGRVVRTHQQGFNLSNLRDGNATNGVWTEKFGKITKLKQSNRFRVSVNQLRVWFGLVSGTDCPVSRLVIRNGFSPSGMRASWSMLGHTSIGGVNPLSDTQKNEWVVGIIQPDIYFDAGTAASPILLYQRTANNIQTESEVWMDDIPDNSIEFNLVNCRSEIVGYNGAGWDIFVLLNIEEYEE